MSGSAIRAAFIGLVVQALAVALARTSMAAQSKSRQSRWCSCLHRASKLGVVGGTHTSCTTWKAA